RARDARPRGARDLRARRRRVPRRGGVARGRRAPDRRADRRGEAGGVTLFFNEPPRVVVQGATGREAHMVIRHMRAYGTTVAAGVTPGRGGEEVDGVPVFDTVAAAAA